MNTDLITDGRSRQHKYHAFKPPILIRVRNMTIAVGERIPEVTFPYIPYAPELDDLVSGASLS